MTRTRKILIALDQFLGSLLFDGIGPDETISAYVWRRGYAKRIAVIDWFFLTFRGEVDHCKNAYMSEKNGTQLAPEYRQ